MRPRRVLRDLSFRRAYRRKKQYTRKYSYPHESGKDKIHIDKKWSFYMELFAGFCGNKRRYISQAFRNLAFEKKGIEQMVRYLLKQKKARNVAEAKRIIEADLKQVYKRIKLAAKAWKPRFNELDKIDEAKAHDIKGGIYIFTRELERMLKEL